MSIPELRNKLSFLRRLLESRSSSYKKLMKLHGRLDLVLTHARSVTRDDIDFSKAQIPLLEVNEGGYDEEDEEQDEEEQEEEMEEEVDNSDDIDSDLNDSYDEEEEDYDEEEEEEDDSDEEELRRLLDN